MFGIEAVRPWLASALEEVARWRRLKADEYPDDPRNSHSADALLGAREYILRAEGSAGLESIALLADACMREKTPLTGPLDWPGQISQLTAGRYFFDDQGVPSDEDHEAFLGRLYLALVDDVQSWEGNSQDPARAQLTERIFARLGIQPRPRPSAVSAERVGSGEARGRPSDVVPTLAPFRKSSQSRPNEHPVDYALNHIVDSEYGSKAALVVRAVVRLGESERQALLIGARLDDKQRELLLGLEKKGLI
jgi:hypothetical protein